MASEALPKRENLAGQNAKSLPNRFRSAKTSLGKAPNGFRNVSESRKPRWAKLQKAPEAFQKRENLAGQSFKWLPKRFRNANTLLGKASNRSRSASEARKPRWAKLQIASEALPKRENLAGQRSKWIPKLFRNAKISLGKAPDRFRSASETRALAAEHIVSDVNLHFALLL